MRREEYLTCRDKGSIAVCACAVLLGLLATVEGIVTTDRVYENYTDHPCIRPCGTTSQPMECVYNFYLEYSMAFGKACMDCPRNASHCFLDGCITSDGTTRWMMTVNQQYPGPAIHVCQGDTIVVRVTNDLLGSEGTTIHWHGILQRGYQHMDGTSRITQCEIPVSSSFEYRFRANDPGTHLWHSHSAAQHAEGIHGALVVRQPAELEPHLGLYDRDLAEHTIVVVDWLKQFTTEIFALNQMGPPPDKHTTLLVNDETPSNSASHPDPIYLTVWSYISKKWLGKNYIELCYRRGRRVEEEFFTSPENRSARNFLPITTFTVERGRRYRFRVIDSGIDECPIQVSIDGHNMTVIASDGSPFERVEVESLYLQSGERYDFILHANQEVGSYWVRFQGTVYACSTWKAYGAAILRYTGAPDEYPTESFSSYEDAARSGRSLNKWDVHASADNILLTNLTGIGIDGEALKEVPDKKLYFKMGIHLKDSFRMGPSYWSQINNIVLREPPVPPLTQLQDLDEDIFCNENTVGDVNCSEVYCECVYLHKVALGDVVELVVVDEGSQFKAVHPMHLHGNKYHVVGIGKLGDNTTLEEIKRLDQQNKLPRNLVDPVAKDTVATNDGGYVILRWHATNPGFWLFHCHNAFHILQGQGVIFQVGEPSEMPQVPRNFPRCGDWKFTGYEQGSNDTCTNRGAKESVGLGALLLVILARFSI